MLCYVTLLAQKITVSQLNFRVVQSGTNADHVLFAVELLSELLKWSLSINAAPSSGKIQQQPAIFGIHKKYRQITKLCVFAGFGLIYLS